MEQNKIGKKTHDKLFRENLSIEENLSEFLVHALPPDLADGLDLETLAIDKISYIDKQHRDRFSDVSASVKLAGQKAYVYLLLEHKSYDDPMALLQILGYMLLKWQEDLKKAKGKKITLTPILPFLFHNGEGKKPATWFSQLFPSDLPENLKPFQPQFFVNLYNLTTKDDGELETNAPGLTGTLWALKYGRTNLGKVFQALAWIVKKYGIGVLSRADFIAIQWYIFTTAREAPEEIEEKYLKAVELAELREAFMSTADILMERGEKRGLEKGMEKGKADAAWKMFEEGIDLLMIARITGLSEDRLKKIQRGEE